MRIAQGKVPTTPCQITHHPVRIISARWPFANDNADLGTKADALATPGPPLRGSSSPLDPAIDVTPPLISLEPSRPANEVIALECVEPHAVSSPLSVQLLDGVDNHTDKPADPRSTSSSTWAGTKRERGVSGGRDGSPLPMFATAANTSGDFGSSIPSSPGTQHTNNIPSSSALSPPASSMLSPIQAQPALAVHSTGLSSSSSSSSMTLFNDPHWSSAQQLSSSSGLIDSSASITATAVNTTSGHFGSSVPSSSSSLHQHQHQQQQGQGSLIVSSNAFSSFLLYLMDSWLVARFEGNLSPIDHPSLPTTANSNQTQQGPTRSQHALPHSHSRSRSHSQVVASNSNTRTTNHVRYKFGPCRMGVQGKPAISISTKGTSGSGSAGRNAQPKSSRKQFSACGACQLRQLSIPHFPRFCIPLKTRRLNLLLLLLLLLFLCLPRA